MTQSVAVESLCGVKRGVCTGWCVRAANLIFSDSRASLSACICDTFSPPRTRTRRKRPRQSGRTEEGAGVGEWLLTARRSVSATLRDTSHKGSLSGDHQPLLTAQAELIYWQYCLWHSYALPKKKEKKRLSYDSPIPKRRWHTVACWMRRQTKCSPNFSSKAIKTARTPIMKILL